MMHACANTCRIKLKRRDASRTIKFWSKVVVCVTTVAFIALYIVPAGSHQNSFLKKLHISRKELMNSLGLWNNPKSVLVRTSKTRFGQQAVERTPYTRRNNMGPCLAKFGKVTIFIGLLKNGLEGKQEVDGGVGAIEHSGSGLSNTNVAGSCLTNDERTREKCQKYKKYLFKRHCIAAEYLKDTDWMLVLDADIGVVNPNHCIEEWIDDRVDVILYERFFNSEISAASFMIRNSDFGRDFLMKWADRELTLHKRWHGLDNGVLHLHVLDTLIPDAIQERKNCHDVWLNATSYETYMAVVSCVRQALGATRLWPGKLRFYRKAHGWVRDGTLTSNKWHDGDFMFHLWKGNNITTDYRAPPFTEMPDPKSCGNGKNGWHWNETKHVDVEEIKARLARYEKSAGETYSSYGKQVFFLTMPVIGQCYPDCEQLT
ncbi:hypothetical protein V3C99_002012 [Haemonchus contortus]|uniref:Nucleotid_trans domain-containing protein n=1 Tax=Haemonchus contortus TaxID=6289 RepID=A0A7I4YCL6_HAECO